MAGHKKYIKQLKPVTFITFDDSNIWEQESGELVRGNEVYDESGNGDPINALLHSEYDVIRSSYRLGQPSMVLNQPTDNYSIVLAPYNYDVKNDFEFSKSWIEILHVDRLLFREEFSFAFLVNKSVNDRSVLGNYVWDAANERYLPANSTNGYNYSSMRRTLIKKGIVSLTMVMPYGSQDYLEVAFPGNSGNVLVSEIAGGVYNRDMYIVMVHKFVRMDDGRFYTASRVYIDNRVVYEKQSSPIYGDYDVSNTASIEIGGNQLAYEFNSLDDRTTTNTKFDQIAVFDYALEDFQVSNLYKKVYDYETMVVRSFPTLYYKMNERESDTVFKSTVADTYRDIKYIGGTGQIVKGKPGVHGVYGSTSTAIQSRGMLYCKPVISNYVSFFNPGGNFTIDFFASFDSSNRGVLLSIQDDTLPFRGLALFVNSRNNEHVTGSIQLSVTEDNYINTVERDARDQAIIYNDGVVRHYAIIRNSNYIELWINGNMIDKIYLTSGALTTDSNQLFMFGLMPGSYTVNGSLQHMAFYGRVLSKQELETRASYMVRYSINGGITVKGVPSRMLLRVYSFNSGDLILSGKSDSNGKYDLNLPSDDYINVVFMDPGNINIRPKIIGPTMPDEYEDLPFE